MTRSARTSIRIDRAAGTVQLHGGRKEGGNSKKGKARQRVEGERQEEITKKILIKSRPPLIQDVGDAISPS